MQEAPTITRTAPARPSKDYALLRNAGIEHIRRLAGNIWTDHNLHDPGITMLEALCYAITEIGHRIDQPVADLLYSHPQGPKVDWRNLFFPARDILPNCPLTIKDYRKLLLDIQINDDALVPRGLRIRDAFLLKSERSEQKVYVQMKRNGSLPSVPETLSYASTPLSANHYTEPVPLNGLYAIQLEFDPIRTKFQKYIDLNDNYLLEDITIGLNTYTIGFSFPYWDALENFDTWAKIDFPQNQQQIAQTIQSLFITSSVHLPPGNSYDFYLELQVGFSDGTSVQAFPVKVKIISVLASGAVDEDIPDENAEEALRTNYFSANTYLPLNAPDNYFQVFFDHYKFRIERMGKLLTQAKLKLYAHRNLCEDYFSIKGIRTQQIATCGYIELLPGADPKVVLADIAYAISEFFSPTYKRYTWQELVGEGRLLEQIFEGPLPANGFIKDEDLDTLQRANAVYTSDLINLIMDVPGVLAVHNFTISNYIDNRVVVSGASDCIQVLSSTLFLSRFDIRRSLNCLKCRKDGIEIVFNDADKKKIREVYERRLVHGPVVPAPTDIPYPAGQAKPLQEYYSVQHDLPPTYGIGVEGLAPSESALRKAQAKQLKAYLLFFDQLLANFLSQLVQLKDYFSMSDKIDRTYFVQPLYEVPRVDEILHNFTGQTAQGWPAFMADPSNGYMELLRTASEAPLGDTFLDRRNRFLDHILARFAEDFSRYSIVLFDQLGPADTPPQLIADKIDFLKVLPEISRCRARAFNYRPSGESSATVWDSTNISGYEKRVCKKLGFKVWDRRNLYWNLMDTFSKNTLTYSFSDAAGNILLQGSSNVLNTYSAEQILQFGRSASYYQVYPQSGQYRIRLLSDTGMLLANHSPPYPNQLAAIQSRDNLVRTINLHFSGEGLHVLEHILLRPRFNEGTFATTDSLLSGYKFRCTALKDPYSFVATVVFPSGYKRDFSGTGSLNPIAGMGKMRDEAFRRFAERTAREEMPAHIFPSIFWLDTDTANLQTEFSLNNFERVFKAWLDQFCTQGFSMTDLVQAQQDLATVLGMQKAWGEACP